MHWWRGYSQIPRSLRRSCAFGQSKATYTRWGLAEPHRPQGRDYNIKSVSCDQAGSQESEAILSGILRGTLSNRLSDPPTVAEIMAPQCEVPEPIVSNLSQLRSLCGLPVDTQQSLFPTQDVVLVCIDCEAYDRDQLKITEVGVAVLDTRDIAGEPPSRENAEKWLSKIKYAHYRLMEHSHLVNRTFVKGRERFFNFGTTAWINLDDAHPILRRIFRDPVRLSQSADFNVPIDDAGRNVVFVAHGASKDGAFLKELGFSFLEVPNVVGTLDTQRLGLGSPTESVGLRRLLNSLAIQHSNLHNGGNDAAYTLQAVMVLALIDHEHPGQPIDVSEPAAPHIWAGSAQAPPPEAVEEPEPGQIIQSSELPTRKRRGKRSGGGQDDRSEVAQARKLVEEVKELVAEARALVAQTKELHQKSAEPPA